jgi:hypothetical protein
VWVVCDTWSGRERLMHLNSASPGEDTGELVWGLGREGRRPCIPPGARLGLAVQTEAAQGVWTGWPGGVCSPTLFVRTRKAGPSSWRVPPLGGASAAGPCSGPTDRDRGPCLAQPGWSIDRSPGGRGVGPSGELCREIGALADPLSTLSTISLSCQRISSAFWPLTIPLSTYRRY